MPTPENIEHGREPNPSPFQSTFAKLVIGGILTSFSIGVFFFLTIAQERSGTAIPPEEAPRHSNPKHVSEDAGVPS